MRIINRTIRYLLGIKRRQLAFERARVKALEETCSILSAYIALLIEGKGEARVPVRSISESIGKYRAYAERCGEDYVIKIERDGEILDADATKEFEDVSEQI